jgi:hypothetical protein
MALQGKHGYPKEQSETAAADRLSADDDADRATRGIDSGEPVGAEVHGPPRYQPDLAGPGQEPAILPGFQPDPTAEFAAAQHEPAQRGSGPAGRDRIW